MNLPPVFAAIGESDELYDFISRLKVENENDNGACTKGIGTR